jgi:hypothetical protein
MTWQFGDVKTNSHQLFALKNQNSFKNILLDFWVPEPEKTYLLSAIIWLESDYLVSKYRFKLYPFGMITLCFHVTHICHFISVKQHFSVLCSWSILFSSSNFLFLLYFSKYGMLAINNKFWEELIAYFPLIRHGPHRKRKSQKWYTDSKMIS